MASQLHQRQDLKAVGQSFTVDVGDQDEVLRIKCVPSGTAGDAVKSSSLASGAATHSIKVEIYDTSDDSVATGYIQVIAES